MEDTHATHQCLGSALVLQARNTQLLLSPNIYLGDLLANRGHCLQKSYFGLCVFDFLHK